MRCMTSIMFHSVRKHDPHDLPDPPLITLDFCARAKKYKDSKAFSVRRRRNQRCVYSSVDRECTNPWDRSPKPEIRAPVAFQSQQTSRSSPSYAFTDQLLRYVNTHAIDLYRTCRRTIASLSYFQHTVSARDFSVYTQLINVPTPCRPSVYVKEHKSEDRHFLSPSVRKTLSHRRECRCSP
jgi:hypothetical protein